jgi:hypothetical protein
MRILDIKIKHLHTITQMHINFISRENSVRRTKNRLEEEIFENARRLTQI